MRIGKPESDEKGFVRFEDIGIGCCFREYDDWNSDEPNIVFIMILNPVMKNILR